MTVSSTGLQGPAACTTSILFSLRLQKVPVTQTGRGFPSSETQMIWDLIVWEMMPWPNPGCGQQLAMRTMKQRLPPALGGFPRYGATYRHLDWVIPRCEPKWQSKQLLADTHMTGCLNSNFALSLHIWRKIFRCSLNGKAIPIKISHAI